jgi:hypothetical protein
MLFLLNSIIKTANGYATVQFFHVSLVVECLFAAIVLQETYSFAGRVL